jgi:hypothetical protein
MAKESRAFMVKQLEKYHQDTKIVIKGANLLRLFGL